MRTNASFVPDAQSLAGRVYCDLDCDGDDESGADPALGGVRVRVQQTDVVGRAPIEVVTDADGRWLVDPLAVGTYDVSVAPGQAAALHDKVPGTRQPVRVTVANSGRVNGVDLGYCEPPPCACGGDGRLHEVCLEASVWVADPACRILDLYVRLDAGCGCDPPMLDLLCFSFSGRFPGAPKGRNGLLTVRDVKVVDGYAKVLVCVDANAPRFPLGVLRGRRCSSPSSSTGWARRPAASSPAARSRSARRSRPTGSRSGAATSPTSTWSRGSRGSAGTASRRAKGRRTARRAAREARRRGRRPRPPSATRARAAGARGADGCARARGARRPFPACGSCRAFSTPHGLGVTRSRDTQCLRQGAEGPATCDHNSFCSIWLRLLRVKASTGMDAPYHHGPSVATRPGPGMPLRRVRTPHAQDHPTPDRRAARALREHRPSCDAGPRGRADRQRRAGRGRRVPGPPRQGQPQRRVPRPDRRRLQLGHHAGHVPDPGIRLLPHPAGRDLRRQRGRALGPEPGRERRERAARPRRLRRRVRPRDLLAGLPRRPSSPSETPRRTPRARAPRSSTTRSTAAGSSSTREPSTRTRRSRRASTCTA